MEGSFIVRGARKNMVRNRLGQKSISLLTLRLNFLRKVNKNSGNFVKISTLESDMMRCFTAKYCKCGGNKGQKAFVLSLIFNISMLEFNLMHGLALQEFAFTTGLAVQEKIRLDFYLFTFMARKFGKIAGKERLMLEKIFNVMPIRSYILSIIM